MSRDHSREQVILLSVVRGTDIVIQSLATRNVPDGLLHVARLVRGNANYGRILGAEVVDDRGKSMWLVGEPTKGKRRLVREI